MLCSVFVFNNQKKGKNNSNHQILKYNHRISFSFCLYVNIHTA